LAQQLRSSLNELKQAVESGDHSQLTIRNVDLNVSNSKFDSEEVQELRRQLGLSQALFARFLGADPKTVQSWEQGLSQPSGVASRWLDEIRNDMPYWRARIRQSTAKKEPQR